MEPNQSETKSYRVKLRIPLGITILGIVALIATVGFFLYNNYQSNQNIEKILSEVSKCQKSEGIDTPESLENCAQKFGLTVDQIKILAENRLQVSDDEYQKGTSSLILNDFNKALDYFNRSVILNPENTDAWSDIAFVTYHLGKFKESIYACEEDLKRLPNDIYCLDGKGLASIAYGIFLTQNGMKSLADERFQDAITSYSKLLELDGNFQKAYDNRGKAYFSLGEYELALKDYQKSLELDGNNPFVCRISNIVLVLLAMGNIQEAQKYLILAKESDPKFHLKCWPPNVLENLPENFDPIDIIKYVNYELVIS